MAMIPAPDADYGTGGLILWPLFGATNQLLAGLTFMVIVFYLWRRKLPIWFAAIPMVIMLIMPAWALCWQLFDAQAGWISGSEPNTLLGDLSVLVHCACNSGWSLSVCYYCPRSKDN